MIIYRLALQRYVLVLLLKTGYIIKISTRTLIDYMRLNANGIKSSPVYWLYPF